MQIIPLRERPELASRFVSLFESEWPTWYGPGGPGDAAADLAAFANAAGQLPVGVVAIDDGGKECGVAALKADGISEFANLGPWAGGGYVRPEVRRRGVGALLLDALRAEAGRLGFAEIYCATSTSRSLLERAGWQLVAASTHEGEPIAVFKSAARPGATPSRAG